MIALIDGDIITHRVAWTTEEESEGIARFRADEMLDRILIETGANEFKIWLSDSKENNFRYKVDPTYKANRTQPKPKHYDFLKEHLIREWGAQISYGMEADDSLGINQTEDSVICSIDKDLLTIPGQHYNFVRNEFTTVTNEEAQLRFYRSILTGDVADNIKGIYGIGPKKAEKLLPKWESEETALKAILSAYMIGLYQEKYGKVTNQIYVGLEKEAAEKILKNARLLKIKTNESEELWNSSYLKPMEELPQYSTAAPLEGLSLYTEPTSVETTPSAG